MAVVASFDLPVHIWITRDVLEQSYAAGHRGVDFTLTTPRDREPVGTGPLIDGVERFDEPVADDPLDKWFLTYAADWPERFGDVTALHRVALHEVTTPPPPEHRSWASSAHFLAEAIGPWFDQVRTWVEVITGQDLDPNHPVYDAQAVGAGLNFIEPPRDGPLTMWIETPRVRPITTEEWTAVLGAVRAGRRAPLVEELSRDARAALRRGFLRRAVIDSASALEVCLAPILKSQADELPPPQREVVQREKNPPSGLGAWLNVAEHSHLEYDVSYERLREVSRVRNRAAHHGETPTYEESVRIVQTMMTFLGAHGPARRTSEHELTGSEWVEISE